MLNVANAITVGSLFTGIGGLDLGLRIAIPDIRAVFYVEREAYCIEHLARQVQAGNLDAAALCTDIKELDGRPWAGRVDILAGGPPCQPVSVAGQRKGKDDDRYLWPEVVRLVREIRPPVCFFENVPGFIEFIPELAGELEGLGYQVEAGIFSAAEVGASCESKRIFILAASSSSTFSQALSIRRYRDEVSGTSNFFYDSRKFFPPGRETLFSDMAIEPAIRGMADGDANSLDRLRALGNAVVPLQAAYAFRILAGKFKVW